VLLQHHPRQSFTLIELLVVVAIIAILASLLLPALSKARDQAKLATCLSNMKNMALGNHMYADDNDAWAVHGCDMGAFSWGATAAGLPFYPTAVFDDDWWDAKDGIPGRNPSTGGTQNFTGVGQLLYNGYNPIDFRNLACVKADSRENRGYNTGTVSYSMTNSSARYFINVYGWAADTYSGGPSYAYESSTYVVRGPIYRLSEAKPNWALWVDHEQALQSLIALVPSNGSPLVGWGRIHDKGLNVAYYDGHAALFVDADRSKTYWALGNQTRFYGNGYALYSGVYDAQ
jgi:prepilin-type N-terminal cleavage/methylation domain-containing protein/prepilin-type processing-associated H-X9-DG protein